MWQLQQKPAQKPPQNQKQEKWIIHTDVAELLQFTLDNEKATDVALTEIAVSSINDQAAAE